MFKRRFSAAFAALAVVGRVARAVAVAGVALCSVAFTAPPAAAQAKPAPLSDADKVLLAEIEAYVNAITTVKARFTQVSPQGRITRGTLYISRPGRLRVDFDPPVKMLIVATPVWLIVYDGELKEPSYLPLKATPAGILVQKKVSFTDADLRVTAVRDEGPWINVTVVQRKQPNEGSMTLTFRRQPLQLNGWTVRDARGLATQVAFEKVETGMPLAKSLFQFVNPNPSKTYDNR